MKKKLGVIAILLLMGVLLPGLGGIAAASLPLNISGYVGVNNTPGSPMVTPLSQWTVTLKKSPYTTTSATASTNSKGYYSLTLTSSMGTGTYRVYETVKTGYKNYTPMLAYTQFTITSSSTAQTANFTNYQLPTVTLNGHKYLDPDGTHTSTATPLSGWTIQLNQSSGSTWSTLATATTDSTGTYQFQVTDAGNYRVAEVEQAGYRKTYPATNYSQTIKGGQTGTITQNFWNQKLMSVKVSGHTYEDTDLTHTSTAAPLAGWKVHLQNQSGTTWTDVASVTTATGTRILRVPEHQGPGKLPGPRRSPDRIRPELSSNRYHQLHPRCEFRGPDRRSLELQDPECGDFGAQVPGYGWDPYLEGQPAWILHIPSPEHVGNDLERGGRGNDGFGNGIISVTGHQGPGELPGT